MPLYHRVDPVRGIVRVEVRGTPDLAEEKGIYQRFLRDPDYRPGMPILVDDRGREGMVDPAEVRSLAAAVSDSQVALRGTRCALLVGSDVQYGMSRVWAARAESSGMIVEVFRDEAEALRWLRAGDEA